MVFLNRVFLNIVSVYLRVIFTILRCYSNWINTRRVEQDKIFCDVYPDSIPIEVWKAQTTK